MKRVFVFAALMFGICFSALAEGKPAYKPAYCVDVTGWEVTTSDGCVFRMIGWMEVVDCYVCEDGYKTVGYSLTATGPCGTFFFDGMVVQTGTTADGGSTLQQTGGQVIDRATNEPVDINKNPTVYSLTSMLADRCISQSGRPGKVGINIPQQNRLQNFVQEKFMNTKHPFFFG